MYLCICNYVQVIAYKRLSLQPTNNRNVMFTTSYNYDFYDF